jgi:hypothetical protein
MARKLLSVGFVLLAAAVVVFAADTITGRWTYRIGTSSIHTLDLKASGTTLTGTIFSQALDAGRGAVDTTPREIKNGRVNGDSIYFEDTLAQRATFKYEGTVSGTEMKLKVTLDTPNAVTYERTAVKEPEGSDATAEFRNGILVAWHAAEEADPFASIRGEFDLTGATPSWISRLRLPYADQCALIKNTGGAGPAPQFWTFACKFAPKGTPGPAATYDSIVKTVQSVLSLDFQPDESALNVNQVFFSDPSKPTWRLVVTKVNPSFVVLWITPQQLPTAMPFGQAAASSEVTIHDQVEKIRNSRYAPMPPAQLSRPTGSADGGRTTMTVKNSTQYSLTVYFDGPVSRSLSLSPGSTQTVALAPGLFHVAGRVEASNVLPFYGDETYKSSAQYDITFYIGR